MRFTVTTTDVERNNEVMLIIRPPYISDNTVALWTNPSRPFLNDP